MKNKTIRDVLDDLKYEVSAGAGGCDAIYTVDDAALLGAVQEIEQLILEEVIGGDTKLTQTNEITIEFHKNELKAEQRESLKRVL